MLYSTVLRLRSLQETAIPLTQGYQAYTMVLRLLQGSSPALTAGLHDDASAKPLTVSPLQGGQRQGIGDLHLAEGDPCWVRVTSLQDGPFCALLDAVLRLPQSAALDLAGCPLALEGLDTVPGQSPWVAYTSFDALLEGATSQRELSLAFLSPTAFRSQGQRNVLFPEPRLAFGSLQARWNAFAPQKLRLPPEALATGLLAATYQLRTRMLDFGSYKEAGFLGRCRYQVTPALDEEGALLLNALADYALFSGIGAKTTMGMGQCRRISNAGAVPHRAGRYPQKRGG